MSSPTAASRLCTAQSTSPVRIDTQAGPALLERFADLQSRCIDPDTFDAADFELWQALDDHAREGSGVLDLRPHGEALMRVYSLLDGRTRLGDLAARVRSPEARLNLLRLTYLLAQTDLARLS